MPKAMRKIYDEPLELSILAMLIRVKASRRLFESLDSKDFNVKTFQDTFTFMKCLYQIDPSYDLNNILAEATMDSEIVNLILASSPPANPKKEIERLKQFSLYRKMIDTGHSLVSVNLKEEEIAKYHSKLVNEIKDFDGTVLDDFLTSSLVSYEDLNKKHFGFFPYREIQSLTYSKGGLIIIGARPGVGKTTFALNLCLKLLPQASLFISIEMDAPAIVNKMLKIRDLHFDDRDQLDPVLICQKISILNKISHMIRRSKKERGVSIVFIDYLQLISLSQKLENRNIEVGRITRELKVLAQELEICIVCLSQLNRDSDGRFPMMSDLRDSGSIEQDADAILLLHPKDDSNILQVLLAKNRSGMAPIKTDLNFIKKSGNIEDFDANIFNIHN